MINIIRKKYISQAFFLSVVLGLCFVFIGKKDICRGVILGNIFSVGNFFLLSRSLRHRIGKPKIRGVSSVIISIIFRYLFMALPLFLSFKSDRFSTLGVITGLFTIQLVIMFDYLPKFFSD